MALKHHAGLKRQVVFYPKKGTPLGILATIRLPEGTYLFVENEEQKTDSLM